MVIEFFGTLFVHQRSNLNIKVSYILYTPHRSDFGSLSGGKECNIFCYIYILNTDQVIKNILINKVNEKQPLGGLTTRIFNMTRQISLTMEKISNDAQWKEIDFYHNKNAINTILM